MDSFGKVHFHNQEIEYRKSITSLRRGKEKRHLHSDIYDIYTKIVDMIVSFKLSPTSLKAFGSIEPIHPFDTQGVKKPVGLVTLYTKPAAPKRVRGGKAIKGRGNPRQRPNMSSPAPDGAGSAEPSKPALQGRSALAASANGGLLNLDRTGKPPRKWLKARFQFKTFSGYAVDCGKWDTEESINLKNLKQEEKWIIPSSPAN